jgi:energy-coupling factor transport system substrate-specific component
MKTSKTLILTYGAVGIVLNVVLGAAVSGLKIPLLFLDTIRTFLISVLFGPWWGALVGFLTNVVYRTNQRIHSMRISYDRNFGNSK